MVAVGGLAIAAKPKEQPIVVRAGNMVLTLNGGVTPKALPRDERVPMGFHGSGVFATVDGTHLPALREAVFDNDKDLVVSVDGLPVCGIDQLTARDTGHAEAACGGSILGKGSATVEVAFPEQAPFNATGPLILFNGGERGGVITLLAYTYVSVPAPTAVVTTATLTRQRKGPFALHAVVKAPALPAAPARSCEPTSAPAASTPTKASAAASSPAAVRMGASGPGARSTSPTTRRSPANWFAPARPCPPRL